MHDLSAVEVLVVYLLNYVLVARLFLLLRSENILCAGAVNGDGQVAPIYLKVVHRITFAATKTDVIPRCPWPPGCLLGAPWVLPGGPLDAYWGFAVCARRHVFLSNKKTGWLV